MGVGGWADSNLLTSGAMILIYLLRFRFIWFDARWQATETGRTWNPILPILGVTSAEYVFSLSLASQADTFESHVSRTMVLPGLPERIYQWSSMTAVVAFDQRSFISLENVDKQTDKDAVRLGRGYKIYHQAEHENVPSNLLIVWGIFETGKRFIWFMFLIKNISDT